MFSLLTHLLNKGAPFFASFFSSYTRRVAPDCVSLSCRNNSPRMVSQPLFELTSMHFSLLFLAKGGSTKTFLSATVSSPAKEDTSQFCSSTFSTVAFCFCISLGSASTVHN
ncbi:hypothetical protein GOP47_0021259 [Adiantum capillus-veneris]|uniref:Uncharacterized protein n=1 Tax=Adiantum capillus-veneris TaxID=13818 RepID=A0A9D4UCB6_ADICA|nr:hypothetical protein GOP47_0021259 [Adiantum capillus-veneris]